MEHEIFISYTQPDRNIAHLVHDALTSNGLKAWVATSICDGVTSGNAYKADIAKAIKGCKIFVLLYSDAVNKSKDVMNEITLAEKKIIIPVRLDFSEICGELLYDLKRLDYIDGTSRDITTITLRLIRDIKIHLSNNIYADDLSSDKVMLRKGITILKKKIYTEAKKILSQYVEIAPDDHEGRFYLALCLLAGCRPEKMDGTIIQRIESILLPHAASPEHYDIRYLLAMIKFGYYNMNGLREKAPAWMELVSNGKISKEKAYDIVLHVNDPNNTVWKHIYYEANK